MPRGTPRPRPKWTSPAPRWRGRASVPLRAPPQVYRPEVPPPTSSIPLWPALLTIAPPAALLFFLFVFMRQEKDPTLVSPALEGARASPVAALLLLLGK